MSTQSTAVILPVTHAQAAEYMHMFANRRAYLRQSHYPSKKSGRFYFYKACNRGSKQPLSLDVATVQGHLEGRFTIGIYAINPESQRSKWTAIDADYAEARRDLLQLQQAFREDGIEALMERSRRGGHLWIFLAEPLPSKLCRLYVLNAARRLGVAIKQNKDDGIEVFPRQDALQPGEFGNAIRGPLGIHRANQVRYWFEDAAPTLDAQLELLRDVKRVTWKELDSLTKGMSSIPDVVTPKPFVDLSARGGKDRGFRILSYVRPVRRSGRNYVAQCPSCAQRGEDRHETHLSISVAEPRMYRCWAGCTKEMIRSALGCPILPSTHFARTA
jgi:hypothetical protein